MPAPNRPKSTKNRSLRATTKTYTIHFVCHTLCVRACVRAWVNLFSISNSIWSFEMSTESIAQHDNTNDFNGHSMSISCEPVAFFALSISENIELLPHGNFPTANPFGSIFLYKYFCESWEWLMFEMVVANVCHFFRIELEWSKQYNCENGQWPINVSSNLIFSRLWILMMIVVVFFSLQSVYLIYVGIFGSFTFNARQQWG